MSNARRMALTIALTLLALVLAVRVLPSMAGRPAMDAQPIEPAQAVRSSRTITLADGATAYRLPEVYTTTIGDLTFVAWSEDRPFDEYGRELPLHFGWHYVKVSPTSEISPTGRWDLVMSALTYEVTETVSWFVDAITPTGVITFETIPTPTIITIPKWTNGDGNLSGTITTSMVITHALGSAPVAGAISVTRYISEDGHIVPGTISATLWMVFEVHNSARGLMLNYHGDSGALTIAAEQQPVFYSAPAYVGDYGVVQVQVQATSVDTTTWVMWWTQFAPAAPDGRCEGVAGWADGTVEHRAFRDADQGYYAWLPLYLGAMTSGPTPLGWQVPTRNACARIAFQGPAGVTFTPTIWIRPLNP